MMMNQFQKQTQRAALSQKTLTFFLSLLALILMATGCEKNNHDPYAPLSKEITEPVVELDEGEGEKSMINDPGVYRNEAPCGKYTVAMIHDTEGRGTYTFGAFGDGQLGVLSALSPDFSDEDFNGNVFASPLELLKYLVGEVPQEVALSLLEGEPTEGSAPFVKEVDFSTLMTINPENRAKANTYCSNGTLWRADYGYTGGWVDNFIKDEFSCGTSTFYSGLHCIEFSDIEMFTNVGSTVAWSQRTGSAYDGTKYGSCAAYGRVVSCGNYTKLKAFRREGWSSGAWSQVLDYWIPANGTAVWKMYSNSDRSCKDLKDRDDFRFRAESVPGATHRYGYTFIEKHITHSSPGLCVACP